MTPKELLLNHLDHRFEQEAWQPSLAMAVQGLTASQAAWKPAPDRHSIWQIVRHVTHWKRATLDAWEGTRPLFSGRDVTQRFNEVMRSDWPDASGTEDDCRLRNKFDTCGRCRVLSCSAGAARGTS